MQQDASAVSSNIVVNAQPATPSAPTAGTVTQPTCATATGSFRLQVIAHPIPIHLPCGKYFGTGLVTATAGNVYFTINQQVVLPASSSIVVNAQPANQQPNSRNSYAANM
jgi:hypothetical protein